MNVIVFVYEMPPARGSITRNVEESAIANVERLPDIADKNTGHSFQWTPEMKNGNVMIDAIRTRGSTPYRKAGTKSCIAKTPD